MRSYSWHEVFSVEELRLYERAVELVKLAPYKLNGQLVRCHELARAVGHILELTDLCVSDGYYGLGEHTWLWTKPLSPGPVLSSPPNILDVYCPGVEPQVVLVDWYNHQAYRRGDRREDISGNVVKCLIRCMVGAPACEAASY